jgi:hypothetical protein
VEILLDGTNSPDEGTTDTGIKDRSVKSSPSSGIELCIQVTQSSYKIQINVTPYEVHRNV